MADGYQLLDIGGGARLERFGDRVTDRPYPAALGSRGDPGAWAGADLRFDRDRGWTGSAAAREPWPLTIEGVTLELRPTDAGQVGLFPEHAAMLPWLADEVARRTSAADPAAAGRRPAVLHLFAYTGLATLATVAAGARVTHVDASRPAVAWARGNAERSGLADAPVRWIVDDAVAFTGREARRGRRYAGVILDPPSYGHGPGGGRLATGATTAGAPRGQCRGPRARRLRAPDCAHGRASRATAWRATLPAHASPGGIDQKPATSRSRPPMAAASGWAPSRGRRAGMMTRCAPHPARS